jgi:hypothetical protein
MLGGGNNFAINALAALRVTAGQLEDARLFSVDDSAQVARCSQQRPY